MSASYSKAAAGYATAGYAAGAQFTVVISLLRQFKNTPQFQTKQKGWHQWGKSTVLDFMI